MRIDVDLGIAKEVRGDDMLRLKLECKDVDGRVMHADASVKLDGSAWCKVAFDEDRKSVAVKDTRPLRLSQAPIRLPS